MSSVIMEKTLRDLEWERMVREVASRCSGPLAVSLSFLPLAQNVSHAREMMAETAEALLQRRDGDPLPLSGIRDVRAGLDRVARSGVLDGSAMRDVRMTLGAARVLRLYLSRRKERLVRLHAVCALDPTLDELEEEIAFAIETDGTVKDSASPELRRLRQEVQNLRARIVARLEQMLIEHSDVMQDRFHTIREGRYVIPMRTDAHDKIPGIVHGTSGSGATVFIEPRALVEQQNRLTIAMAEMEAEEARILFQLSELVRERLPELRAAVDALDRADLRNACARLAEDLRAIVPELLDQPAIRVFEARHPFLALDVPEVVPNDLAIEGGRALVLSGPNAGGKTVALKLLGIFALMVRSGLPVPAREDAAVGFFDPIASDVGDEQSMEKNLSTFSAHVQNLGNILNEASHSALVLLDEVATGTDPGEGAALACAVVDTLCRRGSAVGVTTHYEPLKAMALSDARFRNASVGFDVEHLSPTFHVRMDVPGASSALMVAQRFGLDEVVIQRARDLLPEQARTFDALVRRLEEQYDAAHAERVRLEEESLKATRERERFENERRVLREREAKKLSDEAQKLMLLIRETRDEVRAARSAMRKQSHDVALIEAAKVAVERASQRVNDELGNLRGGGESEERGQKPAEENLQPGMRVYVPRLRAEVEIIEGPTRGRVRVASGAIKLWVDASEARTLPAGASSSGETKGKKNATSPVVRAAVRTDSNTLDLRGLRVDEALTLTESFLDRLYASEERTGYLVHGVGSGALRDAIREQLRAATRYVKTFHSAPPGEGGDKVTIVELR